ncbi:MAG: pitrilysin family protein [Planctomycetota bacterium]
MKPPELNTRRFVLQNGMTLLCARHDAAPVLAVRTFVDAGQRFETSPGVSAMTGRVLGAGAGERTETELCEAIEFQGGTLETSGVGFGMKFLSRDMEFAIGIAADLLCRPGFDKSAVERERRIALSELQAEGDRARQRASLKLNAELYGDHPFARHAYGSADDLRAIDRDVVDSYHTRFFQPGNTLLAIAGRIDFDEVHETIANALGDWPDLPVSKPAVREPPKIGAAREHLITVAREQVHLYLGHLGIRRTDPDYLALSVLDAILGSGAGFSDRLSARVRDELGLAYTVNATITSSAGMEPGLFRAYVGCAPENWQRAREEILAAVRRVASEPVSNEEIEAARAHLAASLLFDLQTAEDVAIALLAIERFGLGFEHPAHYMKRLDVVTPDDVMMATRRHLHPDALTTIALGPV